MTTNKRKIINDPVYGFLTLEDDLLFDVISHPFFQRLRGIKQLGFTYLVYPGAVHSRYSHMLGALNLMGRAIEVLRAKKVFINEEEALGVKLAVLLHDVGHAPFSHTAERMLVDVHHEELTLLFMRRLNEEFDGRLTTAIQIFEGSYPRRFLHQLVSSQLDMDRLDYLGRDSFFTGVSEGIVGTDRIINMLNVSGDELVVDEKGIYSIEKFIISRRLMYWQVYLHKTVVAADNFFLGILQRVRELMATPHDGGDAYGPRSNHPVMAVLEDFLSHRYSLHDFDLHPELLDRFAMLDDGDVMTAVKGWTMHPDAVLSRLSKSLVARQLSAIRVSDHPFDSVALQTLSDQCSLLYGVEPSQARYFVGTGRLENHAYSFNDNEIKVRYKDGSCLEISKASDQLDRPFLEKAVTKYYVFFPKELASEVLPSH